MVNFLAVAPVLAQAREGGQPQVYDQADEEDEDVAVVRSNTQPAQSGTTVSSDLQAPVRKVELDEDQRWAIPPVPWRGQISLSEGGAQQAGGTAISTGSRMFSVSGSSYIWQPWFARVNGSALFSNSYTSGSGSKSQSDAFSFNTSGDVLSASRYPVSMSLGMTSSNGGSGRQRTQVDATSLNVTQSYSPEDASFNTNWSFFQNDSSTTTSGATSKNSSTGLGWGLRLPIKSETPQTVSLSGNWTTGKNSPSGASIENMSVTGSHSAYFEDYVLSLNSDGSYQSNQTKDPITFGSKTEYFTLGTVADWLPSDDVPLKLGGNARYYSVGSSGKDRGAGSNNTLSFAGFANYPTEFKVDLNGSLSAVLAETQGGGERASSSQSWQSQLQANWRPDGINHKTELGIYSANYGGNAVYNYQTTSRSGVGVQNETVSVLSVALSVGHSLARKLDTAGGRPVDLGFSQGYGLGFSDQGELTHSLMHGVSMNWVASASLDSSHVLGLSFSDNRTFGSSEGVYQSLTADWRGNGLITNFESYSTEARIQFSQQETRNSTGRLIGSGSIGAGYTHNRFANILGLAYTVRYLLSIRDSASAISGGRGGVEFDHQVTQQWAWRMGYLGWRIDNAIFIDNAGELSASLYLSVVRDFAGVL